MVLHDYEAEASLLGCILVDPDTFVKVGDTIAANDFYDQRHRRIYQAISELSSVGSPLDILVLTDKLKVDAALDIVGGAAYLSQLSNFVPTGYRSEEYAKIVKNYAIRRKLRATVKAVDEAVDSAEDVDVLLSKAEAAIYAVGKSQDKQQVSSLAEVLEAALGRVKTAQKGDLPLGTSTGYGEMDQILTGFQKSDLVILAARPSMGKTAFALNIARNVAIYQDVPTLIFSLEMSKEQLVDRIISMETGVPTDRLRSGNLSDGESRRLTNTVAAISEAPLYIDDTPSATIQKLRTRARREDHLHHLGLIIIDYLQLMGGQNNKNSNREQEISEISRGLKVLARELNVPVIALSQLSRQVEARTPSIPQLSDLRESGSIEQNADVVAFLYRDDYYNQDTLRRNMTDVLIRKHRNGRIGSVELYFDKLHQRFRGVTTK